MPSKPAGDPTEFEAARRRLLRHWPQWAALIGAALLGAAVFGFVDLEPKVEGDFFFSTEDPQLQVERRIEERFSTTSQIFVAVRSKQVFSRPALRRLHQFTRALQSIPGVASAQSLTDGLENPADVLERDPAEVREDLLDSPFWPRLLLGRDRGSSFVVLRLREQDAGATVSAIDRVKARFQSSDFDIGISGVPYVSEHIRRGLARDLKTFSGAAIACFAILVAILFRSLAVSVGTMVAALTACFITFLLRAALGMETGILTPNLWTIAFVLTLSHVVYLTASYFRSARESGEPAALSQALRLTGPASVWSLVANLLGFLSLLLAPAKPLREFGISGGIAALAAIACAYGIHPLFLRSARVPRGQAGRLTRSLERFFTTRHPWLALAVAAGALLLAPWSYRVDTDPPLPSYFAAGGEIRDGLEAVDRAGGTSPLDLVVRDAAGGALGDEESFERLMALQRDLEADPAVGSVISIAILMAETDRHWYSFLISWEGRLERLEQPEHDRVGRTFITADRTLGRFILRMHERRGQSRAAIAGRLAERARAHGFEVPLVGGLFKLQGELSELVKGSVVRGLGGLLASFLLITLLTSRSLRVALAMTACLALVPLALFGLVAIIGMQLDIIAAPAANVALPMGIDEMIHLGYALRRSHGRGGALWSAWRKALAELWAPILVSALIVGAGFALLLLSGFPPTHRLGALACASVVLTDAVVLLVLPALATVVWIGRRRR